MRCGPPSKAKPWVLTAYSIATRDGESLAGILKNETATAVTLGLPGGTEQTVSRSKIATMQSTGLSIMPDGLEAGLTAQDVSDLIRVIFSSP